MNETSTQQNDGVETAQPVPQPKSVPNYGFWDCIDGTEVRSIASESFGFLRTLGFRELALALTIAGLTFIGVALAWPKVSHEGYRVLGAVGVAILIAGFGVFALLAPEGSKTCHDQVKGQQLDSPSILLNPSERSLNNCE